MNISKLSTAEPVPQRAWLAPASVPGQDEGGKPSILHDYLRIALRWRWVIVGATATCLLLGIIATMLMTPQYTAASTIEISREADQVTNFEGVESEVGAADQEFYQTQYGLLRSRTLAERVANELDIVDDQQFF